MECHTLLKISYTVVCLVSGWSVGGQWVVSGWSVGGQWVGPFNCQIYMYISTRENKAGNSNTDDMLPIMVVTDPDHTQNYNEQLYVQDNLSMKC